MANWQYVLNLKDIWNQGGNDPDYWYDKKNVEPFVKEVARRLKKLNEKILLKYPDLSGEIAEIIYRFENEVYGDIEEFNDILKDLYDIADTPLDNNWNGKKLIWIDRI